MKVDAIVNAANAALQMGGGVCGAIFKAAGAADLQAACDKLAPIQTGEAVITPGFRLSSKYVIHTAEPVYRDGKSGEEAQLRACYLNSLKRAVENACESVAFPLISSGIYGYPKDEALWVATTAIREFLEEYYLDVVLAVFDKASFMVGEQLLGEVASYIDEHYVDEHWDSRRERKLLAAEIEVLNDPGPDVVYSDAIAWGPSPGLDDLVITLDESFSKKLLRLIDEKGRTDAEVYKRANIDRKLFSKIKTVKDYMPSKRTAISLAVALELSLDETCDLLKRAGYSLSHAQIFDVIVESFIDRRRYDIFEINSVLFKYDQPLLGGLER
jgi:O-acetyl-ADP-ribose deacetylase (regulator of RNase III)